MSNLDDEYWGKTNYDISSGRAGGGSYVQIPNKPNEPQGLTDLRKALGTNIMAGLKIFDPNSWKTAQNLAKQAQEAQGSLLGQLGGDNGLITQNRNLVSELANIARTGNIPSGVVDRINTKVNRDLQSSMGTMLNNLGKRGVLNSSITSSGINQLSQNAAEAFNHCGVPKYCLRTVLSCICAILRACSKSLTPRDCDLLGLIL